MKKVITLLMALIVMVTAVPTGNVTAQAAVKPGSVSKVKVSKVTKNSAKVTYKKAKKETKHQIHGKSSCLQWQKIWKRKICKI